MEFDCDRIPGLNPDRFTCSVDGKELTVVLHDLALYHDEIDLSDLRPAGHIHCATIDSPSDACSKLRDVVTAANSGDLLAVFCANAECRKAALNALGIDDAPTVRLPA